MQYSVTVLNHTQSWVHNLEAVQCQQSQAYASGSSLSVWMTSALFKGILPELMQTHKSRSPTTL